MEQNSLNRLSEWIKDLIKMDPDSVARPDLGEYRFSEVAANLKWLQAMLRSVNEYDLLGIEENEYLKYQRVFNEYVDLLYWFKNVRITDLGQFREQKLRSSYSCFFDLKKFFLPVLISKEGKSTESSLKKSMDLYEETFKRNSEEIQKKKDEIENLLSNLTSAVSSKEASKVKDLFRGFAVANWWSSWGLIAIFCVLVFFGVSFINYVGDSLVSSIFDNPILTKASVGTEYKMVLLITTKILFVFLYLVFALLVAKLALSNRHNYFLNMHRSNALDVFQEMVLGPYDPDVKAKLTSEASVAMFAQ